MYSPGEDNPLCCLVVLPVRVGRQRGNNAAHLFVSSPLSNKLSGETESFFHGGNCHSPQSTLSLSFTFTQPYPHGPQLRVLTGLVVLVDFFFNFLVIGVP